MNRDELTAQISQYTPWNEQEQTDKKNILSFLAENENAFLRENELAHMTASAWVVNQDRSKVLMVYHKIYDSWSWTGGHADGEIDLLSVALREVTEETGIRHVRPVSESIFSLRDWKVARRSSDGIATNCSTRLYNSSTPLGWIEPSARRIGLSEANGVAWMP